MKSIYRGIVNQFDVSQIKKDIKDDPDFNRADEGFYNQIFVGVSENINDLQAEIQTYLDRDLRELSPIELSIIYGALYELKFFPEVPYRVVINEAVLGGGPAAEGLLLRWCGGDLVPEAEVTARVLTVSTLAFGAYRARRA